MQHLWRFAMDVEVAGAMCVKKRILYYIFDYIFCISLQHACYDGTISMAMMFFVMLSLAEIPEPDWSDLPKQAPVPEEISFELDERLRHEVQRVHAQVYAEVEIIEFKCSTLNTKLSVIFPERLCYYCKLSLYRFWQGFS